MIQFGAWNLPDLPALLINEEYIRTFLGLFDENSIPIRPIPEDIKNEIVKLKYIEGLHQKEYMCIREHFYVCVTFLWSTFLTICLASGKVFQIWSRLDSLLAFQNQEYPERSLLRSSTIFRENY